ncbi:RNA polymerase sigma factor SigA [Symmachiella macrocystis]|uniref:RNA polymerase sigma factor SigA n=1 Tax=Symmachiella macrocystis TaxID=2527985 RepID=A0A5C6BNS5_9PLAN|nr:sigma-70 family RNA polymerase sigma factor [Symmachiella macrocystis]TWU13820.1 RNA polymerase sigma factor SigA [Symmachiella macrocystis]
MSRYRNPAIRQLTEQQVRYTPRDARLRQIERAEQLLEEIDLDKEYHYNDLCQKITTYKAEMYPHLVLSGADAAHDVRLFVEDLSDSADIAVESLAEPVLTVGDVSEQFNVSTKTVDRWRSKGLVSRRFKFGNRKRIGFLKSSVDRFVRRNSDDVHRSTRFSQLTVEEREDIITRARRFARAGGCPAEISRRIAKRLGRSPETIRYTLKHYDAEHPESAVFPHASGPLTDEGKKQIYRNFRRGIPVERLAKQFCRTKASIYRIVSEMRAQRLIAQPIDFIDSEDFVRDDADKLILGPVPVVEKKAAAFKPPPGLPPYLASLYRVPLLTKDEEVYYFRKMNYLKFKAAELRGSLDSRKAKSKEMDAIEKLLNEAVSVKNLLIRSNLRLVVSIAKRHFRPNTNFFEMVSDGNMSLMRAIEKFDYSRGNKFSTYATWAIMKNFARSIPAEHTRLDRFRTGNEEVFQAKSDTRSVPFELELNNQRQHEAIMSILSQLDDREKDIILFRFGLNQGTEPQTLEQVGYHFGVTKERIRQLEARALNKLRKIAQEARLDIPGV